MRPVTTGTESTLRPDNEMPGFIPVKVRSFFPGTELPCDFYFPSLFDGEEDVRPDKILGRGDVYSGEKEGALLTQKMDTLYIAVQDETEFIDYLSSQTRVAIRSQDVLKEKKTQLLYDNAEAVVKKVFREHPNESTILIGKQIVEDFTFHITSEEITASALTSLFSKDYYTFSHCVQVATLGMAFCRSLGWNKAEIEDIGIGILFHDLGKNRISDEILNKPGRLDPDEFETIKQHPLFGFQQLKKTNSFTKDQLSTVLHHHEAMDGSGYPDGLSGDEIPRYARLTHIIDVFDALTSERVYKKALSQEDALKLMSAEMQHSFDREMLGDFIKYIQQPDASCGLRQDEIKADLWTPVFLQFAGSGKKTKSILVGMERYQYIALRLTDASLLPQIKAGMEIVMRYVYSGAAYGFKGVVMEKIGNPPIILSSYPAHVEKLSLRSEPRKGCFLPAEVEVGANKSRCAIVDLSYRGCRVSIRDSEREILSSMIKDLEIMVNAHLPGRDGPVCLRGSVKNIEKSEDYTSLGIQFSDKAEQSAEHWKAFIDNIIDLDK